ncbi:MAG: cysteine desulfurase [Burkholderiales bacterium]|nr:cysteine desulfurase [Burkholderiales bacterium]
MSASIAAAAPVYLDWNATTPVCAEAMAEMLDAMQHAWANPSSTHAPGQAARRVLADARLRVASFLGARPAELVFTSGATEANHLAVLGALASASGRGGIEGMHGLAAAHGAAGRVRRRLVLSAVEHPGLLALADRLAAEGTPVHRVPVDREGRLDLAAARASIDSDVALVSLMGANNETGVCMPLAEVAALAHAQGALLHVDATQLAGKAQLSFAASGADLMSVSAHKIGGPKGVGALLVRKGVAITPLIAGRQERHRRGGTENLPGIAGFAAACERTAATLERDMAAMAALRHRLEQGLAAALPAVRVLGAGANRLPNTSCLSFGTLAAELVLARLERAGIVASSGAACSAGGTQPSHVLLAMGLDEAEARSGVRFSLGRDTSAADIERTVAAATAALAPLLRADANATVAPSAANAAGQANAPSAATAAAAVAEAAAMPA